MIFSKRFSLVLSAVAAVAAFGVAAASDAHAERTCKDVKKLNEDLGCGLISPDDDGAPTRPPPKERMVEQAFGPTDCKIVTASSAATVPYKAECKSWLKEEREDLKGKPLLDATCSVHCDDCSVGPLTGKACTVQGVVHYTDGK